MDTATYRHVFSQIKKSCPVSHSNFPCHNLVTQETLLKLSQDFNSIINDDENKFLTDFPCYKPFDYRVELTTAFLCGSGGKDLASDLVKRKSDWERKLVDLKVTNVERAIASVNSLKTKNPKKLSQNVINYLQHIEEDPEPKFHGTYNWLYSGGNLHCFQEEDNVVIVSSDYQDKASQINMIKLDETLENVDFKLCFQIKNKSPVLQVTTKSKNENLFILIRLKNYTYLMRTDKHCLTYPLKLWQKKTVKSKLMVSSDIQDNCKRIVISDSNHDVHVFDVETKSRVGGYSIRKYQKEDKDRDAWNHVMFGNDDTVYLGLRKCLYFLDLRDEHLKPEFVYSPSVIEDCEEICSFTKSSCDSNYLYVATTHNLFQVDVRNMRSVQRWTHLMKSPPQFISCTKENDRDFVVIQSEQMNESLGITNDYISSEGENHFLSKSLPCLLESAKESLKIARLNGLCLNPIISKRFGFAVTGIQCLKNKKGDIHLYTGNSGGDIFLSKIKKAATVNMIKEKLQSRILESMKAYEAHFENFPPSGVDENSIQLIDMKNFVKELVHSKPKPYKYKEPDLSWKYHEMYDPKSLMMCRDVMAQKILKAWVVDDTADLIDEPTISSEAKVREWMEKL